MMPNNPAAFPISHEKEGWYSSGMSLRDWFATFAPQPDEDAIKLQFDLDHARNPHNEPYHNKPQRRERARIVADLRYAFADAMLASRRSDNGGVR